MLSVKKLSIACIFTSLLFTMCKKRDDLNAGSGTVSGSFSSFSMGNIIRGSDSAVITWSPSTFSVSSQAVKYKVRLDNGVVEYLDTVRQCVLRNLSHTTSYNGSVIAYVANGDSSATSFSLKQYNGFLIIGRTDVTQNQNVVEAYDVFSGDRLWRTKVSDYFQTVFTEPEISNDTVFINANQKSQNLFFALSLKTGQLYYSSITGNSNTLGQLTYSEGRIFSVYNTTLIAINTKNGAVIWNKFASGGLGFSAKTFIKDNIVYAATTSGIPGLQYKLYAMDVTAGTTKWEFPYDGEFYGTCYPDGKNLYFTTATGIYCIDAITGTLVWKRNNDNNFKAGGQLVIVNNAIIFSGPRYYGVYCIDKLNGTTLWNYKNASYLQSTISYGNGLVYFNEIETNFPYTNNLLTALNVQTGNPAWSKSSNYMFTLFAGNRIYSRSNMRSDIEVTNATDGAKIFRMMNPGNYYVDNLTRFSLVIDEKYYFFPAF